MKAGGRSGSAYYEMLARQRGVGPAALETYLRQFRAVEQAEAKEAPTVTEYEVQAGMVSYAIECAAAIGLAALIVLAKVLPP